MGRGAEMILAKEFEGELWIKAADHNRLIKAEREAIRTRLAQPEQLYRPFGLAVEANLKEKNT
jgi:plasmid stability protein